jgi:protein-L-isoaspartate(D-aspartate) O-methyltransferase
MIEHLRSHFIKRDLHHFEKILEVIGSIPRHIYVPLGIEHTAYDIAPVLIERDQTMSSPLTVALQTYFLNIQSADKVFEIGTGSGYQASVLHFLAKSIDTVERHDPLFQTTKKLLNDLKYNKILCHLGDGFLGWKSNAPYDKIIVTCGAPFVPQHLVDQLSIGGILLVPVTQEDGSQEMLRIIKLSEKELHEESLGVFNFVPMLEGIHN